MTDHGRFRVDRWLRAESLADDLLAFLAELGLRGPEVREAVTSVGPGQRGLVRSSARFTDEQIGRLYELNPTWASIERRVYGGLDQPGLRANAHT